jgi:hypothetical protein
MAARRRAGGGGRGARTGVSGGPKLVDTTPLESRKKKQDFPSARQRSCAGLNRRFYPPYQRDLIDYDYDQRLPQGAREWLAAFTEEHYRGWRLTNETQLNPLPALREADAARSRARRALKGIGEGGLRLEPLDSQAMPSTAPGERELVQAIDKHAEQRERQIVHSSNTRSK